MCRHRPLTGIPDHDEDDDDAKTTIFLIKNTVFLLKPPFSF